jgi:hypothetical protein
LLYNASGHGAVEMTLILTTTANVFRQEVCHRIPQLSVYFVIYFVMVVGLLLLEHTGKEQLFQIVRNLLILVEIGCLLTKNASNQDVFVVAVVTVATFVFCLHIYRSMFSKQCARLLLALGRGVVHVWPDVESFRPILD